MWTIFVIVVVVLVVGGMLSSMQSKSAEQQAQAVLQADAKERRHRLIAAYVDTCLRVPAPKLEGMTERELYALVETTSDRMKAVWKEHDDSVSGLAILGILGGAAAGWVIADNLDKTIWLGALVGAIAGGVIITPFGDRIVAQGEGQIKQIVKEAGLDDRRMREISDLPARAN